MQLLTSREAAERIHVSLKTLYRLRAEGGIRYVAITERKIMYRPEDCDEFIAERVELATNELSAPRIKRPRATKGQSLKLVPFSQRT
jgi:excisionase family DNA binding protein